MAGELDLAIELSRRHIIAAAERKLARALTESERTGIARISSLLRLESIGSVIDSPDCTPVEVLACLTRFAQQGKSD